MRDHDGVTDKPDDQATGRRPRRPNLEEIFGDVLPATTSDEREPEPPDTDQDSWYERNRPPHHDRG
jgi:hypothetical protein